MKPGTQPGVLPHPPDSLPPEEPRSKPTGGLAIAVVCPTCHGSLAIDPAGATCGSCARTFGRERGFLDLLDDPLDRFEDEGDADKCLREEVANTHSTVNFSVPLLRRLFPRVPGTRVLSAGCGVGIDVDLYVDEGVDAYGIDCGQRTAAWTRRRHPGRFSVANAKALPFEDGAFDLVSTGCLLPHIGVAGDTTTVTPSAWQERARAARELVRVVRPGGYVILANPNRLCPFDLHHLQPRPERLARPHSWREPFLLSLGDHRRLFLDEAGCQDVEALPVSGYWGFHQKSKDPKRRWLVPLARLYFDLVSARALKPLRASPLNPWLIVAVRK